MTLKDQIISKCQAVEMIARNRGSAMLCGDEKNFNYWQERLDMLLNELKGLFEKYDYPST